MLSSDFKNKKTMLTIKKTEDNSDTLFSTQFGETYHSIRGAYKESMHVFINAGLEEVDKSEISVFEVGFGTGLNAFLSLIYAEKNDKIIHYFTVEKFPVDIEVAEKLNFAENFANYQQKFTQLHVEEWGREQEISKNFIFLKEEIDFNNFEFKQKFDVIFFDAFSYDSQPEMWSAENFKKIYSAMNKGGILVTYSAKGIVKQSLREVGFEVKRLKGYKKRHMLRAKKLSILTDLQID